MECFVCIALWTPAIYNKQTAPVNRRKTVVTVIPPLKL